MAESPSKQNTGAVVVAFNPDVGLIERLEVMRRQVGDALVVDNTLPADRREWLTEATTRLGIELISNERNLGVGAALNQGLEWARERKLDWLLTLDQDTFMYDCLMSTVGEVFDACPIRDNVALIGSNYLESYRNEPWWPVDSSDPPSAWTEVISLITSGTLVSVDIAGVLGPFREDYFVDLIDFEYCLRARGKGYGVILAKRPLMDHSVGEPTWCRLLWKTLTTPNHSQSRHYYYTRNHLVLIRQYLLREPGPVLGTVKTRLKEVILVACCESGRWRKVGGMIRGVLDALRGRMGQMI